MRAHNASHFQDQRTKWSHKPGIKAIRIVICLGLLLLFVVHASLALSEVRSPAVGTTPLSSDQYVLRLQPLQAAEPGGYLLLDAPQLDGPASGCCCKVCLPSIQK